MIKTSFNLLILMSILWILDTSKIHSLNVITVNPYPADHDDHCRFYLSVLLVDQINVIGNAMCV